MPAGGRALLPLPALTSRTVETAGTARNLDLAFWHADSREFEGHSPGYLNALWRNAATGLYEPAPASRTNDLRLDALFAWQPTPGTVFFAGYGGSLREDDTFAFRRLSRSRDGFFMNFSYLFRL